MRVVRTADVVGVVGIVSVVRVSACGMCCEWHFSSAAENVVCVPSTTQVLTVYRQLSEIWSFCEVVKPHAFWLTQWSLMSFSCFLMPSWLPHFFCLQKLMSFCKSSCIPCRNLCQSALFRHRFRIFVIRRDGRVGTGIRVCYFVYVLVNEAMKCNQSSLQVCFFARIFERKTENNINAYG